MGSAVVCLSALLFSFAGAPRAHAGRACAAALPQSARTAESPRYRSEEVTYRSGSVALAALLMLPESQGRVPAAVIIQGSGASDRTNLWARAISEVMVARGVAVLLTDKRGSGKSDGNWQTSDFNDLAADALAGVELLRSRKEIDPARVGLVGLSQGGWIAPLAAARSENVAFVIDISGATVSFAEQSYVEMANTARQAGLDEKGVREVLELNRAAGEYLITGDWAKYAAARERGLKSGWSKIAAGFPGSPDLPIWTFLRGVSDFDPMPYWIQLGEPVLAVFGERDEEDNVPVGESVRRLRHAFGSARKENYRIEVIPGAGHSLMDAQKRELLPQFVAALTSWLAEFVLKPGDKVEYEGGAGAGDVTRPVDGLQAAHHADPVRRQVVVGVGQLFERVHPRRAVIDRLEQPGTQ